MVMEMITEAVTLTRSRWLNEENAEALQKPHHRGQHMRRRPIKLFSTKCAKCANIVSIESGKCAKVAKEMDRYKLEILGLSEVRWNTSGQTHLATGI